MSKPRKPFGNPPGRLAATMIKVLAAELCDAGRLTRGKQLWAESAVIDIVVGHGTVTAEVQGGRRHPYVVTIDTDPGAGMPKKADLWAQCTCPDSAELGARACKHAVAALFALSDEVAVQPDLLERWRGGRRRPPAPADPAEPLADPELRPDNVRPLRLVRDTDPGGRVAPSGSPTPAPAPPRDPSIDQIAAMLQAGSTAPPTFPEPAARDHPLPPGRLWATALHSALDELKRLRWD